MEKHNIKYEVGGDDMGERAKLRARLPGWALEVKALQWWLHDGRPTPRCEPCTSTML